jgi:YD repeat-containing protein
MTKRFITLTLVLLLLLSPATGIMGTIAQATDSHALSKVLTKKDMTQAEVDQAIKDARKNAIYDEAGRISKATIDLPGLGKSDFEYKYDEQNRLLCIIDSKGRQTRYEYSENGALTSITLPNGTRMYELDKEGKGVFFKGRINSGRLNVQQTLRAGLGGLSLVMDGTDCTDALADLAIASAAAVYVCTGGGDPLGCAIAVAAVVVAFGRARRACVAPIDDPVV